VAAVATAAAAAAAAAAASSSSASASSTPQRLEGAALRVNANIYVNNMTVPFTLLLFLQSDFFTACLCATPATLCGKVNSNAPTNLIFSQVTNYCPYYFLHYFPSCR
jgi:hypothetical protein